MKKETEKSINGIIMLLLTIFFGALAIIIMLPILFKA